MAKLAKREKAEKEERGGLLPWRSRLPAFPLDLMERIDEILGERWSPWWTARHWPEEIFKTLPVDVFEQGDEVVVKTELPGMKREDIEIQVSGDVVTISGKKEKEEKIEKRHYFRWERSAGSFSRSVRLPAEVQVDKVTAQLKEGVLEIRGPKTETAKATSRKIEVA